LEQNPLSQFAEWTTIGGYDVDVRGRWKTAAILRQMSLTAQNHCQIVDPDNIVFTRYGMFWVLMRAKVELGRSPAEGEKVEVLTKASAEKGRVFNRLFLFRTEKGEQIGAASTIWLLLNMTTRSIGRLPDDSGLTRYVASEFSWPTAEPRSIRCNLPVTETQTRRVRYSDLDMNRHMNNARYMEWVVDLLGLPRLQAAFLREFQINYLKEATWGMDIETTLMEKGEDFCVRGKDLAGGAVLFEACGKLTPE
jgi:medium-chain acyl-[acyl-carrier-protein] hydrolase